MFSWFSFQDLLWRIRWNWKAEKRVYQFIILRNSLNVKKEMEASILFFKSKFLMEDFIIQKLFSWSHLRKRPTKQRATLRVPFNIELIKKSDWIAACHVSSCNLRFRYLLANFIEILISVCIKREIINVHILQSLKRPDWHGRMQVRKDKSKLN